LTKASALGVAALGVALEAGASVSHAQPIPEGRPPEWSLAAGYGSHLKISPRRSEFGLAVLMPAVGFRLTSRLEYVDSATFERYASPSGYFIGVLPVGARYSIGNGKVSPYLGVGVGFGWTNLEDGLYEISRRFNFRLDGNIGLRFGSGESSGWTLEGRYQHTSNAGTSYPNVGIDSVVGLVGWQFR
jgi:hypothetical protein